MYPPLPPSLSPSTDAVNATLKPYARDPERGNLSQETLTRALNAYFNQVLNPSAFSSSPPTSSGLFDFAALTPNEKIIFLHLRQITLRGVEGKGGVIFVKLGASFFLFLLQAYLE